MPSKPVRYLWAVVRELALGLLVWVATLTALFGLFEVWAGGVAGLGPRAARTTTLDQAATGTEPLVSQWLSFVWRYTTLDYGTSILYQEPVRSVVVQQLGWSLFLAVAVVVVGAVLAVPAVLVVARVTDSSAGPVVRVLAALAGSLSAAVLTVVVVFAGSSVGYLVGFPGNSLVDRAVAFLAMAVVVSLPLVGWIVRDAGNRFAAPGANPGSVTAALRRAAGDSLRATSMRLWLVGSYVAAGLFVVEPVFAYPGVGFYWHQAVLNQDVPLIVGLTAAVLGLVVVAGVARNVLWAVGAVRSARSTAASGPDPATDGGDSHSSSEDEEAEDDDGASADDAAASESESGGEAAVTESVPSGDTTNGAAPGDTADAPTPGSALRSVVRERQLLVGGLWLGSLAVLGIVGSALLAPESPSFRDGMRVAFGPGQVVNSLGFLVVVALGAVLAGGVPGALVGSLAGLLETDVDGIPGRAAATALRVPTDVLLVAPVLLVTGLWLLFRGPATGRAGMELLLVVFGGLSVGAYAFRSAQSATSSAPDSWGRASRAAVGVPAGLSGCAEAAVVVAFAAVELTYLGLVPSDAGVPAVVQLTQAYQQGYMVARPGYMTAAILQAVVPLVLVGTGLLVLAGGIDGGSTAGRRG